MIVRLFILFSLISLPLATNLLKVNNLCLNGYDIGIYYQAIVEISVPDQLNPMLSVRGIPAFNDHFNPILIPISILLKVFGPLTPSHVIVFEWLAWLSGAALLFFLLRKEGQKLQWTALFLLLFSKGILTALYFPVHVDFWSMPLWILFAWSLYRENTPTLVTSMFLICLFKESYPIAFLFTGSALLWMRRWKTAAFAIVFGLTFTIWNLWLRPIYLGSIHGHGTNFIRRFFESPTTYSVDWFHAFPFGALVELYLIPCLFLALAWKRNREATLILLATLMPLFGLQIFTGLLEFHYAFPMTAGALAALCASKGLQPLINTRRLKWLVGFAIVLPGASMYANSLDFLWKEDTNCRVISSKRAEFELVRAELELVPLTAVIGASGGVIPNLIAKGRDLRHLHSHALVAETYDYLVLEVGPVTHSYPLDPTKVEIIRKACEPFATNKVLQGTHFILWKGPFPSRCIHPQ